MFEHARAGAFWRHCLVMNADFEPRAAPAGEQHDGCEVMLRAVGRGGLGCSRQAAENQERQDGDDDSDPQVQAIHSILLSVLLG